jgi:hypothetical protein
MVSHRLRNQVYILEFSCSNCLNCGLLGCTPCVILQVDTDISEKHAASIFRAEECRVSNWLDYTGRWSLGPLGEGKKLEPSLGQMGMVHRKMTPCCDTKHSMCLKKTMFLPTVPTRPGLHFLALSCGYQ